ncbi:MAG: DUF1697 domain-containing protein [Acidithiobacillales bacterium]
MTTYVALLRGINVGGHRQVTMAGLRELLKHLRLSDGRSLLQSGNLVFRAEAQTGARLEHLLEAGAEKRLGLRTDFFVRSAKEWMSVVARNRFREEAERDPRRLVVMFLKESPVAGGVEALQAAIDGPEVVRAHGKHAYIVYPNGMGRSHLTNALIEKKLGTRATARNWNTVQRLRALASA